MLAERLFLRGATIPARNWTAQEQETFQSPRMEAVWTSPAFQDPKKRLVARFCSILTFTLLMIPDPRCNTKIFGLSLLVACGRMSSCGRMCTARDMMCCLGSSSGAASARISAFGKPASKAAKIEGTKPPIPSASRSMNEAESPRGVKLFLISKFERSVG